MNQTKIKVTRYKNRKLFVHMNDVSIGYMALGEIGEEIANGGEVTEFVNKCGDNYIMENIHLNVIKVAEPKVGDTALLNRIIRNGGLIKYTNLLEFVK